MVIRKLLHYFTDHEVMVVTLFPLGDIVLNRDAAGRISKWALELMGHDIRYIPRTAIKSQVLMDFVTEWTEVLLLTLDVTHEYWTMYFDGSIMALGSGAGVVLISLDGGQAPLHDPPPLFGLKQCCGIRGPHQRTAHRHRARRYVALRPWRLRVSC